MKKRRGLAKKNDIFLEVTTRASHNLTNGHMSRVAKTSNAKLLINTDTNSPNDLINKKFALKTNNFYSIFYPKRALTVKHKTALIKLDKLYSDVQI